MLNSLVEEDQFELTVIRKVMILLKLFDNVNNLLQIRNFLVLSCIELQNVGKVDVGVSLSDSEVDLEKVMHLFVQPVVVLLVVEPILQDPRRLMEP